MVQVRIYYDFKKWLYCPKEIKSVGSYHKNIDLWAAYINFNIVFEVIFGLPEFIELMLILDLDFWYDCIFNI